MKNIIKGFLFITLILIIHSCKSPSANEEKIILLYTTLGDIKIRLYDSTPVHRDNFIKLIKSGFYDNVTFHRVIKDFMIQTGDPSTRLSNSKPFPDSINTYTLPAEPVPSYYHKRGAVAAARRGNEENPEMRSSGTQFYIVQGVKYNEFELDHAETVINNNIKQALFSKIMKQTSDSLLSGGKTVSEPEVQQIASLKIFEYLSGKKEYKIPEYQRVIYKTIGGVPRLDCTYTVFGEVIYGMDVVDRIASVSTDITDKPLSDVRILKIKIISRL